mgnify:CR=1 FL=1
MERNISNASASTIHDTIARASYFIGANLLFSAKYVYSASNAPALIHNGPAKGQKKSVWFAITRKDFASVGSEFRRRNFPACPLTLGQIIQSFDSSLAVVSLERLESVSHGYKGRLKGFEWVEFRRRNFCAAGPLGWSPGSLF